MSVPPRPPSGRAGSSGGRPTPGRRQTPRRSERIRYSAARIEDSHWRRNALIALGVVAVVVGSVGWYRHLTRPPVTTEVPAAEAPVTAPAPVPGRDASTRIGMRPAATPSPTSAAPGPPSTDPLMLSARELEEALGAAPGRTVAQAFADYQGREVTWSGNVVTADVVNDLLRVELKDDDGVRFIAWCEGSRSPAAGTRVTVRGHLESRDRARFVLDRCNVM